MSTVKFLSDKDCSSCPLSMVSPKVCQETYTYKMTGENKCIVFIGHAPDFYGATNNLPFYGKQSNIITEAYIKGSKLCEHADIFFTNMARCCPDHNQKVKNSEFKLCQFYTNQDLETLSLMYDKICAVLLGVQAVKPFYKYVLGETKSISLTKAITDNGKQFTIPQKGIDVTLFSTYHPNMVLFEHNNINTVETHMKMLYDWTVDVKPESSKPIWVSTITPNQYRKGEYDEIKYRHRDIRSSEEPTKPDSISSNQVNLFG